ncbi:efflux transporter outer membrane subunit [Noviherbaspirillum galbum]|uniref:Efflux transporter outer membrane subunit n=1 Tax=Noviherbaspirillum galbum TaxID=2709383 RepID=A0A6B3SKM3_9BURK|nr:efflux transporter outer membrane subunit [Noviherbaspirillum galbum]NEX59895.1 efflux transporter outer membrane subunit [Noviherbaspirillum galbum]
MKNKTMPIPAMPSKRLGALALAASMLAGCASYAPIPATEKPITAASLGAMPAVKASDSQWPTDHWWQAYGDPQLDRLITHALDGAPSLASARARIVRAQAAIDTTRSASQPHANAGLDLSYGRQSENYLLPKPPLGKGGEYISQGFANVNFGMDLDLWGRNAVLIDAANASLQAAEFDRDAARLALTTSIARAYAQLAAQYELQDVLQATLEQRRSIVGLARQRVSSGLDTQVEVKQAQSSEAALRIEQQQLATAMKVTRLQIAALSGDMPDSADKIARPRLASAPFSLPSSLPLDLLGRRPELAAQRARIAAAASDKEAARLEFYPNINLTGLIGFQSIGLGQLLSAGSLTNSIGPAIRLPLFDAGRLRANYAGRASDVDAAIAQYNQSVVNAAQDVAEQLARIADLDQEEALTRDALQASEEAYRLAMLRYKGGLSPYLTALTVEGQLLTQRRALASLEARRQDLGIALVRALGGGFADPSATQASAAPNAVQH